TPEKPKTIIAMISMTLLFLNICSSFFNLGISVGFIFGVTMISPIKDMMPTPAINQKTYRQSNIPPIKEPKGTPNIPAIVNPTFTRAIAAESIWHGEILIAIDIQSPKKGACMIAEHKLDNIIILKVGAIAANILLNINTIIIAINSGFGENRIVSTLKRGPKIATPIAYALNSKPVVETGT